MYDRAGYIIPPSGLTALQEIAYKGGFIAGYYGTPPTSRDPVYTAGVMDGARAEGRGEPPPADYQ